MTMDKIKNVQFVDNPAIKPGAQFEPATRIEITDFFQKLKDLGTTGGLERVMKEFWDRTEYNINLAKLRSDTFDTMSLNELINHGKTLDFFFSDEQSASIFHDTLDQAKNSTWHTCR
jgi:hypothetical protein